MSNFANREHTYRSVLLASEGYPVLSRRPIVTRHEFVRREVVQVEYAAIDPLRSEGANTYSATALIYRCTETGVERRWGLE